MSILSSVSSSLEFWSVNNNLKYENSGLKYLIMDQKIHEEWIISRLLNHIDNCCWQYYNLLILHQ